MLLCLALAAGPAAADEGAADRGAGLIEEGARLMIGALLDQAAPKLKELHGAMTDAMAEFGPALAALLAQVDDLRAYAPPEMLPNGDIILRRRAPLPPAGPLPKVPADPLSGAIDL